MKKLFYLITILLFFQDSFALILLNIDLYLAQFMTILKDILIIFLLCYVIFVYRFKINKIFFRNQFHLKISLLLIFIFILYFIIGISYYPIFGVIAEFRAILMPILLYFIGTLIGSLFNYQEIERYLRFIYVISIIIAFSGIIDYFFLTEEFWRSLNIAQIESIKGAETSKGELPDNFYSIFGRRALGITFNPLLLSYLMITPIAFSIFYYKNKYLTLLFTTTLVLTFSRLPILGVGMAYFYQKMHLLIKSIFIVAIMYLIIFIFENFLFIFQDGSAIGHFELFFNGLYVFIDNPLGYGLGSAGVFASSYSPFYSENSYFNLLNQIGIFGGIIYFLFFIIPFKKHSKLDNVLKFSAISLLITAIFSPQIFVIKASFLFFILIGIGKNMTEQK